jgi:hypothetical protein
MQKILFIAVVFLISSKALAQELRFNAYGAYVFEDGYSYYIDNNNYYNGSISDGFQWGAGIEYLLNPAVCVELMYLNRSTDAPTSYQAGLASEHKQTNFDVNLHYILLGSDFHGQSYDGKMEGYGGIFGGVSFPDATNPENGNKNSETNFTWAIRLGGNFWASEKVGIKLQAQLLSTFNGAGGSYYFGYYPGGVALNTYSNTYQFGLGGGLTFKLGKSKSK